MVEYRTILLRMRLRWSHRATLNKLLSYVALRQTQPPNLSGAEMSSSLPGIGYTRRLRGAVLDQIFSKAIPPPNGLEAPSGVWCGRNAPQPTRGLGERRELPAGSWAEAGNAFWRILKATERSFFVLIFIFYTDALSSSNIVSCHIGGGRGFGDCLPAPTENRS